MFFFFFPVPPTQLQRREAISGVPQKTVPGLKLFHHHSRIGMTNVVTEQEKKKKYQSPYESGQMKFPTSKCRVIHTKHILNSQSNEL